MSITAAVSAIHCLMTDPSFRRSEIDHIIEGACWSALGSLGPAALPAIHSLMTEPSFVRSTRTGDYGVNITDQGCCQALGSLRLAARQFAPLLLQRMGEIWPWRWSVYTKGANWNTLFSCLAAVSPEDALTLCGRSLEEGGKNSEQNEAAVQAARALGKAAIPTLEKFCGPFSGERGRLCKAAISALRNDQKS
jgi:hypothetical protein